MKRITWECGGGRFEIETRGRFSAAAVFGEPQILFTDDDVQLTLPPRTEFDVREVAG